MMMIKRNRKKSIDNILGTTGQKLISMTIIRSISFTCTRERRITKMNTWRRLSTKRITWKMITSMMRLSTRSKKRIINRRTSCSIRLLFIRLAQIIALSAIMNNSSESMAVMKVLITKSTITISSRSTYLR